MHNYHQLLSDYDTSGISQQTLLYPYISSKIRFAKGKPQLIAPVVEIRITTLN